MRPNFLNKLKLHVTSDNPSFCVGKEYWADQQSISKHAEGDSDIYSGIGKETLRASQYVDRILWPNRRPSYIYTQTHL